MLASEANTLYKQLESCKTAKAVLDKQDDIFRDQATLARKSAITSLMNDQKKSKTPIKDHIFTLLGYLTEVADNEANLEQNTQIEMVLKRLSKEFVGFRATYKFGSKNLILTQIMNELQSYELILNDSQPVQKVEKET